LSIAAGLLLGAALLLPFLDCDLDVPTPEWVQKADRLLPMLSLEDRLQAWVVDFTGVPTGSRSLPDIIGDLFGSGDILLGLTILFFSLLFPCLKIVLSVVVASPKKRGPDTQSTLVKLLGFTKNWSMADVFLIALVVIFFKAEGLHLQFEARSGLYCFAAAALLSSLAVMTLERAERQERADELIRIAAQVRGLESGGSSALADRTLALASSTRPLFGGGERPLGRSLGSPGEQESEP